MQDSDARQKSQHSIKLPYLYKEGSKILQAYVEKKGSLKSLVYATRQDRLYKRLLALVCRAVDNQATIDAVLGSVGLLAAEPGLAPSTARLLTAELLFGTGHLASEARPVLTVLRYADRLRAAAAAATTDRAGAAADRRPALPRYARVNTLLASVDDVINQLTDEGWERVEYPPEVTYEQFIAQVKSLSPGQVLLDLHVPCLLVFPAGTELHQHPLYRAGQLILQDKASCLPPVVLAPSPGEHVIDACSAPGMKTSQLAAMMNNMGTLLAVERDKQRFQTLSAMLKKAGATNTKLVNGDFMKLRPEDHPRVTAILLDPSCSGTGMVSRELEEAPTEERLRRLANLQGMLLRHALRFPSVRRVVYSTCSVTEDENEQVVAATLAAHPGWRLAAAAPATWRSRGRTTLVDGERCIRADPSADLCHGFFVAAFEKWHGGKAETAEAKGKTKKQQRKCSGERQNESSLTMAGTVDTGGECRSTEVKDDGVLAEPKTKKDDKVAERSGTRKRGASNVLMNVGKSTDTLDEEPRKRKKQKQSETLGRGGNWEMSVKKGRGETNPSSSVALDVQKPDVVSDGGAGKKKKKKAKKQNGVSEVDKLRDGFVHASGEKETGDTKKRKKKRERSVSDESDTGAVPAKRGKSEKGDINIGDDSRVAKKRKKSGRLSKRRRDILKKRKPAAVVAK